MSRSGRQGAVSPRCLWSNRPDPGTREITFEPGEGYRPERLHVCPEHEGALLDFMERVQRDRYRFLGGIGLVIVGGIASALLEAEWAAGAVLLVLGIVILRYPFATPQTVQMVGVRSSIRLVRILAVPVIVLGLFLLLRGLV